jgi:hypothetical protein
MTSLTDKVKLKNANTLQELRMKFVENPNAQTLFYELLAELKNQPV